MAKGRIAVTGLGLVCPVGLDVPSSWAGLLAGRSGISQIEGLDLADFKVTIAGQVKDFDPTAVMEPKEARKADRYSQFAMAAAVEAMNQAQLEPPRDPVRAGVIIGSGMGGMTTFEDQVLRMSKRGPRAVSPMFIPMTIGDMAAGLVSIRYGFRGPNFCTVSACASGAHAIAIAADQIRNGHADVMITGGAEAGICTIGIAGFANMKALSTRNDEPEKASRPFDAERDGFVMGEGAGIMVLESEEHARARGAEILGFVRGYGATGDAYHMTQPDNEGRGAIGCMQGALTDAGLTPADIDYINAHGTSTYFNDKIESMAIRRVFGEDADRLKVSSTKSMTGHLLGAAGAIEAVISIMAMREGKIPPTINLDNPDPECDLDYCPHRAVDVPIRHALSNSFGFGGHNISLCFSAAD